jgi:hypothetical protein
MIKSLHKTSREGSPEEQAEAHVVLDELLKKAFQSIKKGQSVEEPDKISPEPDFQAKRKKRSR